MGESLGDLLGKAIALGEEFESKRIVRTQAGANKYKVPIGSQIGTARNAQNQAANKDPKARAEYNTLISKYPSGKISVGQMSTADLESLSRLAYSFRSANQAVVSARVTIANELAKRGLDVRNFGSLAGGKPKTSKTTAKAKATAKKATAKKKTPTKRKLSQHLYPKKHNFSTSTHTQQPAKTKPVPRKPATTVRPKITGGGRAE